jgi:hypothetical protein
MSAMAQRARQALALLLPFLVVLLGPSSVSAGTCPTDATGVLEKTRYAVGETLPLYGTYDDFADPGDVTIVFTRPVDGLTRTFKAGNLPDGEWMRNVVFTRRSDAGSWRIHVTVVQTSGTDVCDDRFTLVAGSSSGPSITPPPTDASGFGRATAAAPAAFLVLAGFMMIALAAVLTTRVRRRT